uniref:Uncharacterized protein n=1 Tax=Trypanosoma vivax (strain Y486) TaxID=1055687 RepID=G0U5Y5_TRYVY|nr:hypothetical protein, unlikely [Trypanosoma vivax Y486]
MTVAVLKSDSVSVALPLRTGLLHCSPTSLLPVAPFNFQPPLTRSPLPFHSLYVYSHTRHSVTTHKETTLPRLAPSRNLLYFETHICRTSLRRIGHADSSR